MHCIQALWTRLVLRRIARREREQQLWDNTPPDGKLEPGMRVFRLGSAVECKVLEVRPEIVKLRVAPLSPFARDEWVRAETVRR